MKNFSESEKLEKIRKIRKIDGKINEYLKREFFFIERYKEEKRLQRFEYQLFSQSGEDGIIAEIFRRIGLSNCFFIEFGVGNGLENNTRYLLQKGWKGLWIEKDPASLYTIKNLMKKEIANSQLVLSENFVTIKNIEAIFKQNNVPKEPDLLSIDIDGNDYWIWQEIKNYQPRVVVIEYNSFFLPPKQWIMEYQENYVWKGNNEYSASLKSMEILAKKKGYYLVGCNFCGLNAFFIRSDLVGQKFLAPFTAENHYEKDHYELLTLFYQRKYFGDFIKEIFPKE